MTIANLCFLIKDNKILFGKNKRGISVGKWNGVGGKVQAGETMEQALVRETKEEITVTIDLSHVTHVGSLLFKSKTNPALNWSVEVFTCTKWEGKIQETEEVVPRWFSRTEIPFDKMWPDDKYWFPFFLGNHKFEGEFRFDETDSEFEYLTIKKV